MSSITEVDRRPTPAVSLAVEPDEQLTTDWLKRLLQAAREWAERKPKAA